MNITFANRTGIPLFADFYTLSTIYDKDNFSDNQLAGLLLPVVKKELLKSAATAIFSEIQYYRNSPARIAYVGTKKSGHSATQYSNWTDGGHTQVFKRFGVADLISELIDTERKRRYYYAKRHKAVVRLVSAAKIIFNRPGAFSPAYGGPKWSLICKYWLNLHKTNIGGSELFVHIDKMIDAAHNTGRCLDKVYPEINGWLSRKTSELNPYWVVNQSCFRKYAKMRMREQYKFTEERFNLTTRQIWNRDLDKLKQAKLDGQIYFIDDVPVPKLDIGQDVYKSRYSKKQKHFNSYDEAIHYEKKKKNQGYSTSLINNEIGCRWTWTISYWKSIVLPNKQSIGK